MNFYELIQQRQSTRKYIEDKDIPRDVIERIIEAGRMAPSAVNAQPWHFVVVDDPQLKKDVAQALTFGSMNKFAAQAPVLVVIVEEPVNIGSRIGGWLKRRHYAHIDIGIAAEHIALAATEEGVGSCIMGWLDERKIQKLLGIPRSKSIPLVISLGYTESKVRTKSRKALDDVLSYNKY